MALTVLYGYKGTVKRPIDYARNPEKTADPTRRPGTDGEEIRTFVTGIHCREETAAEQFMETKEFWSRDRVGR